VIENPKSVLACWQWALAFLVGVNEENTDKLQRRGERRATINEV